MTPITDPARLLPEEMDDAILGERGMECAACEDWSEAPMALKLIDGEGRLLCEPCEAKIECEPREDSPLTWCSECRQYERGASCSADVAQAARYWDGRMEDYRERNGGWGS